MSPETQTHTLPLLLMAVLVLAGLAALGRLYYRKRQLQAAVEGEFQDFRAKAVALMDQLDALRQRHRTLPATDPDFTVPMSGATLALYNAVEADLNALWERWLQVMERWDQAQKLVRSGSGLAVRQAEEARRLLDQADIDELLRQSGSCKERLDRLNSGHEQARAALDAGREELDALRMSLGGETGVVLPSDPHHDQIVRTEAVFGRAGEMIAADPIGAEAFIARARRSLADAVQPPARRPERVDSRPRPAYSLLDDLAAAADAFRSAAARLRLTNLLGVFVRFWMIVWGIGLLMSLLGFLMPLIIFAIGFAIVVAGFWVIWQVVAFWFWYGMWGMRR